MNYQLKSSVVTGLLLIAAGAAHGATFYMAKPVQDLKVQDQSALIGTAGNSGSGSGGSGTGAGGTGTGGSSGSGDSGSTPAPTLVANIQFNQEAETVEAFSGSFITQSFTLTNSGTGAAKGLNFSINQGNIADTTCGNELAAGDSCEVFVEYLYSQTSDTNVLLSATATGVSPAQSTMAISYLAPLQNPVPTESPVVITGTVNTSKSKSFTLKNNNAFAINLGTPSFLSGFISSNSCGLILASGASCSMTLRATPTSTELVTTQVQIMVSKSGQSSVVSIPVTIQGIEP